MAVSQRQWKSSPPDPASRFGEIGTETEVDAEAEGEGDSVGQKAGKNWLAMTNPRCVERSSD